MEPNQLPLRDIHLPPEISWWPPAPGWWLLAVLIPLLIIFGIWLYKRITRKTALKTAKKLLLEIKLDTQKDNSQKLKELSALLRRVAMNNGSRSECAGLTGDKWLDFLNRPFSDRPFSQDIGRLLIDAPYRPVQPDDNEIRQLGELCEKWLKVQGRRKR